MISCKAVTKCCTETRKKVKNGFKEHLPAIFLREFFHVCIIVKRLVQFQLFENSLVQINSKLNSKPYDYLKDALTAKNSGV